MRIGALAAFFVALGAWAGTARAAGPEHKIVAPPGTVDERTEGVRLIGDYGAYRLYRMSDDALTALPRSRRASITVADEMDVIHFDAQPLHVRTPNAGLPPKLLAPPAKGEGLQLVQFVGPIRQEWLDRLQNLGVRPVQYIESNAYLVYTDAAGRNGLGALVADGDVLQYSGPFHPYYKLGPTLRGPLSAAATDDRLVPVTVQILSHPGDKATREKIESSSASVDSPWRPVLSFENVELTLPLARIAEIAALPDVTWVEERLPITLMDEVQDQIVANHLDAARTGPSGTGYKAFLDGKGFSTDPTVYPIVNLSDDGAGNGSVTNGAGDVTLTKQGDGVTTRLAYVTNCTTDANGASLAGHGHINLSIVGGYDIRTESPYQDADGYNLGLGVNPYGRLAAIKIFRNDLTFDTSACGGLHATVIANTYNGGARISSNSWGAPGAAGTYDSTAQTYDAGTRDALPSTAGNQELLFVFAAGNSGPGATTVGSPGNGKNIITVGASENFRSDFTDQCGYGPTFADSAQDVASFSSRGPSPGARAKPDVIAPGTHIAGTASPVAGFTGIGTCGYQPTTQSTFVTSSGTSHATPAVAGIASLYYRWLQDHYLSAVPSPALTKAYMIAHTTYLTGSEANDTYPSNSQGYGMPSLEMAFDSASRYLADQSVLLDNSGDTWTFTGSVVDSSKPVRIVMVYTDAPGAQGTSPQVNNLNLAATVGANTYLGNHFVGQYSVTGGSADSANNAEAIFLPAGTTGTITATVTGFNIAGDGVRGSGDITDQDFAFVCYNCTGGGAHAKVISSARVADTCASGGAGNNDSVYDGGEDVQFSVTIKNDGADTLTGTTVTVTPTTAGVTMVNGSASTSNITAGSSGTTSAPHFTAHFPATLTCGSTVSYDVSVVSAQGSWTGTLTQTVGQPVATALSADFTGGLPAGWTITNGGAGGGAAATWTTANPGARVFTAPMASPVMIVDSAQAGAAALQDEQLVTPARDLLAAASVTLDFDEFFRYKPGGREEKGDVDVKSSLTGGVYVNVMRNTMASNPSVSADTTTAVAHRTVDITAQAAGATGVQIRFHYYSGQNEYWWEIDNVALTYFVPSACLMHPCGTSADLALTHTDGPDPVTAGQNITYTVTATNNGPDTAVSNQLTDTIPANTTFQSITPQVGWGCTTPAVGGTGTITCTGNGIASGGSAAFTIVAQAKFCAGNGTIITNNATVSTLTVDPTAANNSAGTTTTVSDSGACNDGNACTQTDACQAGTCVGSNPVVCTASDQCHNVGTCNTVSGVCSNPVKPNGTSCDDGNVCTTPDVCTSGTCSGTPVPPPSEVSQTVSLSQSAGSTTIAWSDGAGDFNVYRGTKGGSPWAYNQVCFASHVAGPTADSQDPGLGTTFYYLVTRKETCGESIPGRDSAAAPIPNPTPCP